ncbi:MAG: HEAT repeat domain-containing protein [Rhodospirillales bacterium]|nr:HEAT repeat domain-containing protein [Rhodospirillales bacterium]
MTDAEVITLPVAVEEPAAEVLPPEKKRVGRPRGPARHPEARELARKQTKAAIKTLKELLSHPDGKVRVQAARELLDRGHGKAASVVSKPTDGLNIEIHIVE